MNEYKINIIYKYIRSVYKNAYIIISFMPSNDQESKSSLNINNSKVYKIINELLKNKVDYI